MIQLSYRLWWPWKYLMMFWCDYHPTAHTLNSSFIQKPIKSSFKFATKPSWPIASFSFYWDPLRSTQSKGNPIKLRGASASLIPLEEFMDLTEWVRRNQAEFERDAQTCELEFQKLHHDGQLDYPNCELESFILWWSFLLDDPLLSPIMWNYGSITTLFID